jgi:hypothetical protein
MLCKYFALRAEGELRYMYDHNKFIEYERAWLYLALEASTNVKAALHGIRSASQVVVATQYHPFYYAGTTMPFVVLESAASAFKCPEG